MKNLNEKLIKLCRAKDRVAQKQLYELLLPYLRAIAVRYIRQPFYLQDVLQVSFIKIYKNLDQFDPFKASLKTWAARITINSCLNYNKRMIGTIIETLDPEKHKIILLDDLEHYSDEALLKLLKQMPENYYEVYNLYLVDGYNHDEIAQILGINETLSRKRLSRAKAWIKKSVFNNTKFNHLRFSSIVKN